MDGLSRLGEAIARFFAQQATNVKKNVIAPAEKKTGMVSVVQKPTQQSISPRLANLQNIFASTLSNILQKQAETFQALITPPKTSLGGGGGGGWSNVPPQSPLSRIGQAIENFVSSIGKKPTIMEFRVGEGLLPSQRQEAIKKINELARPIPLIGTGEDQRIKRFFANTATDLALIVPTVIKSLKEAPGVIASGGREVPKPTKVPGAIQRFLYKYLPYEFTPPKEIKSYFNQAQEVNDTLVKNGIKPNVAAVASSLLVGGQAILDISFLGSLLETGARAAVNKIRVPEESQVAAWESLGKPETMEEAQINYYKLSHMFHPDRGGDEATMAAINNAYTILKEKGIPNQSIINKGLQGIYNISKTLLTPISELGAKTEVPRVVIPPQYQLPMEAGTIPEYAPQVAPGGLSIQEFPAKKVPGGKELIVPEAETVAGEMSKQVIPLPGEIKPPQPPIKPPAGPTPTTPPTPPTPPIGEQLTKKQAKQLNKFMEEMALKEQFAQQTKSPTTLIPLPSSPEYVPKVEFPEYVKEEKEGVLRSIKRTFAPGTKESEAVEMSLRKALAHGQQLRDITIREGKNLRKLFKLNQDQFLDYYTKIQTGRINEIENPLHRTIAQYMRRDYDAAKDYLLKENLINAWRENYAPNLFQDPEQARRFFAQSRELGGRKFFQKQRALDLLIDGVKAGLKPLSSNPIDFYVAYMTQFADLMNKREFWKSFIRDNKLAKFVPLGQSPPPGYDFVNDRIANVWQYSEQEKGLIQRGRWALPSQQARILNNYASRGLRGMKPYEAYRYVNNVSRMVMLSFSAFHASFVSLARAAMIAGSGIADIISSPITSPIDIAKGVLTGNMDLIKAGASRPFRGLYKVFFKGNPLLTPITTPTSMIKGYEIRKAWDLPWKAPEYNDFLNYMKVGGQRVRMDQFYDIPEVKRQQILNNLKRGRVDKITMQVAEAGLRSLSRPIMRELVPTLKSATFADKMVDFLKNHPTATEEQVAKKMAEISDDIDNMLGELVTDNLFWNNTFKDITLTTFLSATWNIGSLRGLGGGFVDIFTKTLRGKGISERTKSLIGIVATTMALGALYGALHGELPEEMKDYFYPKTGKKNPDGSDERIALPTYMKDVFSYIYRGPLATLEHKTAPLLNTILSVISNKDYWGYDIRDKNAPIPEQIKQVLSYIEKSQIPFSIQAYQRRREAGESPLEAAESFFGIIPAPSYITQTTTQKRIREEYTEQLPAGATPAERERWKKKAELRRKIQSGEATREDIYNAVNEGIIKPEDLVDFVKEAKPPSDVRYFSSLPTEKQVEIFLQATPEERQKYLPYVNRNFWIELAKAQRGQ